MSLKLKMAEVYKALLPALQAETLTLCQYREIVRALYLRDVLMSKLKSFIREAL